MRRALGLLVLAGLLGLSGVVRGDDPDPFPAKDWIGQWELTYSATYSTCDNVAVGDGKPAKLAIRVEKGVFKAKETSPSGENEMLGKAQKGAFPAMMFTIRKPTSEIGLELTLGERGHIKGRRVIANPGPCAIVFEVTGKRH